MEWVVKGATVVTPTKERVAIVGAGRMGLPMAHVMVRAGHPVDLVDIRQRDAAGWDDLQQRLRAEIENNVALLQEEGLAGGEQATAVLDAITLHQGPGPYLAKAGVVFEALPERMDVKAPVYKALAQYLRPDAIVGSVSSTFHPDEMAVHLAYPEQFIGAHWLNPAFIMPVVEVTPGSATSAATRARMVDVLQGANKVPVVLKTGRPGFIIPRLQTILMNEAARMVAEGVAEAAELDRAVRLGLGYRFLVLGLLEFADWGGIDTLYYASGYLSKALDDEKFAAPPAVADCMEAGHTGMKAGRGFYDWNDPDKQGFDQQRKRQYLQLLRYLELL